MSRRLILLTYAPQRAADAAAYDRWIRERDYPAFRQHPAILEYSCFRVVRSVQGRERFTYFDLIFLADGVDFQRDLRTDPTIRKHAECYHQTWFETPGPHNMTVSLADEIWG